MEAGDDPERLAHLSTEADLTKPQTDDATEEKQDPTTKAPARHAHRRRKPAVRSPNKLSNRHSETADDGEVENNNVPLIVPEWNFLPQHQIVLPSRPEETANEHMALVVSRVIKDMVDEPEIQNPEPKYYQSSLHDGSRPEKVHVVFKTSPSVTSSPTASPLP
jgi:hypothetical protein